jgi:hypothetical protein
MDIGNDGITGIPDKSVATVMENKANNNNTLLLAPNSAGGFTEIFNKNPNRMPATAVNKEPTLKNEF